MSSLWGEWRRRAHRSVLRHLRVDPSLHIGNHDGATSRMPLLSTWYGRVVAAKRQRDLASAQRLSPVFYMPVISVGNFTFGATGKTPCVMFLADLILQQTARQPHKSEAKRVPMLLTRGYGDDEWRMFASRFPSCKVAVGADRLALGTQSVARYGSEQLSCVLLEDGLQQWKIKKDLEIVMVDALAPFGNGKLLPHGSLRELPADALARADIVLVHHANLLQQTEHLDHITATIKKLVSPHRTPLIGTSEMVVSSLPSVDEYASGSHHNTSTEATDWSAFQGKVAVVFCGVGNPESVELVVRAMGCWADVEVVAFPDHFAFTVGDLEGVRSLAAAKSPNVVFLTTEKDVARSTAHIKAVFAEDAVHVVIGAFQLGLAKEQLVNRVRNLFE